MAPSVRSVGAASAGGNTTPHSLTNPTIVSGDLLVAVFEMQAAGTSATGWTEEVNRSQTAATGTSRLCVTCRIADGSEGSSTSFTINGTINHVHGEMMSIQNHGLSTLADLVVGTAQGGAASGSNPQTDTALGITVTADSLILIIGSTALDAASTTEYSNFTNANLTSITERMDDVVLTGNGGGFGLATGVCAGTSTGDSTFDRATNEAWNAVHLGVKPAAATAFYSSTANKRLGSQQLHRSTNLTSR